MALSSVYNVVPVMYDEGSRFEVSDKSIDGINFSHKGRFLIISSRPIPHNTKIYMEAVITYHVNNPYIKFLPIMVGIHKNPLVYGVLGSDFCMGTIYYGKSNLMMRINRPEYYTSFMVMQRYQHLALKYQFIKEIDSRMPLMNSIIGIGVDMPKNLITIFVDGEEFYSFSPFDFDMNEEPENFYLALYESETNTLVKGIFNLGTYKISYTPENWYTITDFYYNKKRLDANLFIKLYVAPNYESKRTAVVLGDLDMNNTVAPVDEKTKKRKIEFITSNPEIMLSHTERLKNRSKQYGYICPTDETDEVLYSRLKFPIPVTPKIYFVLTCWGHEFIKSMSDPMYGYVGLPLTLIISKNNDWSEESLKNYTDYAYGIDLFHERYHAFKLHTYLNGEDYVESNEYIFSSSIPEQPQKIGVLLDLEQNKITIMLNGVPFTKLDINKDVLDFTSIYNQYWFYIVFHPELLKKNDISYIIGEFGDAPVSYIDSLDENDNIMTLYEYYNYTIKEPLTFYFNGSIQVIEKIDAYPNASYITSQVMVEDPNYNEYGPGLNQMFNTYNNVSNTENEENTPDKTTFEMLDMIEDEDNNNRR